MRSLDPVPSSFFDDAPFQVVTTAQLRASPDHVFAVLAEPETWPQWFPMMTHAAWTSNGTPGVGAEREVALRAFGGFRERFIAWDPGVRYAFTMTGTTSPLIDAMAEDYRLTSDGGGTRLVWTIAAQPSRIGRVLAPGLRLVLGRIGAAACRRLDRFTTSN